MSVEESHPAHMNGDSDDSVDVLIDTSRPFVSQDIHPASKTEETTTLTSTPTTKPNSPHTDTETLEADLLSPSLEDDESDKDEERRQREAMLQMMVEQMLAQSMQRSPNSDSEPKPHFNEDDEVFYDSDEMESEEVEEEEGFFCWLKTRVMGKQKVSVLSRRVLALSKRAGLSALSFTFSMSTSAMLLVVPWLIASHLESHQLLSLREKQLLSGEYERSMQMNRTQQAAIQAYPQGYQQNTQLPTSSGIPTV